MRITSYQNQAAIKKEIALSFDFSGYVARNKNVFKGLPRNPCIVVIDPKDKKMNKEKIAIGKRASNGKGCYVAQKIGKKWEVGPIK